MRVVMSFSQRWRVGLRQKKTLTPVGEKRDISSPGSDHFKKYIDTRTREWRLKSRGVGYHYSGILSDRIERLLLM